MASPPNSAAIAAALAKPDYVPAGITQAFLEQNRDQPAVVAILFIGVFVTLIVALRCHARVFIVKSFGLDDWLALLSMVRRGGTGSKPSDSTDPANGNTVTLHRVYLALHCTNPPRFR